MDLSVTIGGVYFPNILSNAAGTTKLLYQAQQLARSASGAVRVGVKVSPYFYDPTYFVDVTVDSTPPDVFDEVVEVIIDSGVSHVVTMNTIPRVRTRADDGKWAINSPDIPDGYGGLAGPTVKEIGLAEVRRWRRALPIRVHVVGVGGITSGEDILDYLNAGASAVQIGTALDAAFFYR